MLVVTEVAEKPALGVVGSDAYGACCRVDQDDAVGVGSVVYDVLGWVPYLLGLLVSCLLTCPFHNSVYDVQCLPT